MITRKFHKHEASFEEKLILFADIEDMTSVEITLPDPPQLKYIEGYARDKRLQMWRRRPLPQNFYKWDNVRKREYIDEEWRRITHGYYFMNNGKITYITGAHYMYLQWWRTKGYGFPQFWMSDHDYFHFWDSVKKNEERVGMIDVENRQGGKTGKAAFLLYYEIFRDFRVNGGLQSKTDKDADKFFRDDILYPWRNLPYFFRPKFDNSSDPTDTIHFKDVTRRGEAAKAQMGDWDSQMRDLEENPRKAQMFSKINYAASTANAYDNATLKIYIRDEFGKCQEEVDIVDSWNYIKPSLINQNTKKPRGKALFTSTIEFMEKKAGQRAKDLWRFSSTMDNISGLAQYFVPDHKARFRDHHGVADEERAKGVWEEEYAKLPPNERAGYRRKHPRSIRDAFAVTSQTSHFNTYNLNRVLEHYAPYYLSTKENYIWKVTADCPFVTQGNFEWVVKDQRVEFFPDPDNGRFFVSYLFENSNMSNRMGHDGVARYPLNTVFGVAGCDTFGKSLHGEKKQRYHSDGSLCVYRKYDMLYDDPSVIPVVDNGKDTLIRNHKTSTFCCTLRHRHATVEELYEDVLKCIVYYGIKVKAETNVRGINEYIISRGFGGYLWYLLNIKTGKYNAEAGETTQAKTYPQLINAIRTHVQVNGLREVHRELIHEWSEFDDDFRKFDRSIASGHALLAAQKDEMMVMPEQTFDLSDFVGEGMIV